MHTAQRKLPEQFFPMPKQNCTVHPFLLGLPLCCKRVLKSMLLKMIFLDWLKNADQQLSTKYMPITHITLTITQQSECPIR